MKTRREALKAGGIALAGGVAVVALGPKVSITNPIFEVHAATKARNIRLEGAEGLFRAHRVTIEALAKEMREPELVNPDITHDAWQELQKYADRLEQLIGGAS